MFFATFRSARSTRTPYRQRRQRRPLEPRVNSGKCTTRSSRTRVRSTCPRCFRMPRRWISTLTNSLGIFKNTVFWIASAATSWTACVPASTAPPPSSSTGFDTTAPTRSTRFSLRSRAARLHPIEVTPRIGNPPLRSLPSNGGRASKTVIILQNLTSRCVHRRSARRCPEGLRQHFRPLAVLWRVVPASMRERANDQPLSAARLDDPGSGDPPARRDDGHSRGDEDADQPGRDRLGSGADHPALRHASALLGFWPGSFPWLHRGAAGGGPAHRASASCLGPGLGGPRFAAKLVAPGLRRFQPPGRDAVHDRAQGALIDRRQSHLRRDLRRHRSGDPVRSGAVLHCPRRRDRARAQAETYQQGAPGSQNLLPLRRDRLPWIVETLPPR